MPGRLYFAEKIVFYLLNDRSYRYFTDCVSGSTSEKGFNILNIKDKERNCGVIFCDPAKDILFAERNVDCVNVDCVEE